MISKSINLLVAGLILATIALGSTPVHAAPPPAPTPQSTANNGQALEIAPPVIYLSANPGQTIKTQIFLRDISSGDLIVTGQANDFVASGENGNPKILLNGDANDPYSLRTWINPPSQLLLVPKEIKTMNITVNVPASASPGGHYGVIRFTATPPNLQGTGVSLSASLGSLILLTVNGKISENLSVKEFSAYKPCDTQANPTCKPKTGTFYESGPLTFVTRLTNSGNVHEQPVGQITITDMFGKKLASLNVNLPPKNALPNSTRRFESPLDSTVIGNKKLFGRYKAVLKVNYSKDNKVVTSTLSFWIIPYKLIAILIVILIAAFFGLRYALRRYNRYILERSRDHHRRR